MISPVKPWFIACCLLFVAAPVFAQQQISIGIISYRPKPQTLAKWSALANSLNKALPEYNFVIGVYDLDELSAKVASRQIDFVLTNPSHYLLMAHRYGMSAPLASLTDLKDGKPLASFGGVIFTRADRADIQELKDLRNKSVAAISVNSFGGYQMQAYELHRIGLRIPEDIKFVAVGAPQDNVVDAVISGKADVGFVRSDVLENLTQANKLDSHQIKVLNKQDPPGFPYQVSTPLYPEWVFACLHHADKDLMRKVTAFLLNLEEDRKLTQALDIYGFNVPQDLTPVESILREMRMPPYDVTPAFTLRDIWKRYQWWIIAACIAIAIILLLSFRLLLSNRKLFESEARFRNLAAIAPVVIYRIDAAGRCIYINDAWKNLTGCDPESVLDNHDWIAMFHPQDRHRIEQEWRESSATHQVFTSECRVITADQETKHVLVRATVNHDSKGMLQGYVGTLTDITEHKRAEEKIRLISRVFESTLEGIIITNAEREIIEVNEAFTRITGYTREEVIGKNPRLLKSGHHDAAFYAAMWNAINSTGHWSGEVWNRCKNNTVYPQWMSISVIANQEGKISHYVGVSSDITLLKQHERQLEHIAHYDALTGIPNRVLLVDRMQQARAQTRREKKLLAICYLDLDGFKAINDSLGHDAGDIVLIKTAERIGNNLRGGDTVARLGGDEFVILLLNIDNIDVCHNSLTRLLQTVQQPILIKGEPSIVTASIGVTLYPMDDEEPETLLRHADQAMYLVKQTGKNRYHIFDPQYDSQIKIERELRARIEQGLLAQEFELFYQPKVTMKDRHVVGAEALIRWRHPERGLLNPSEFLPIIETTELDVKIGEWVIDTALKHLEDWRRQGLMLEVSINITATHLQSDGFIRSLASKLSRYPHLNARQLQIEVLETEALADIARVGEIIGDCAALGVRFALDDFGTGYSSLAYLRKLPADTLKIDQTFVRDMLINKGDLAIVQGVIALAHAFNRITIAEGVETEEHFQALAAMGCDIGQGYGIAVPMPVEAFGHWMHSDGAYQTSRSDLADAVIAATLKL